MIDNFAMVSRSQYYCSVRSTLQCEFCINVIVGPRAGAKGGQGGLAILRPPINKLTRLKTDAFVFNFKLLPPLINA